jgi:hypothetical protein
MARSAKIRNVISKSYPGSSLLDVQLIADEDPDLPFYKDKFFIFFSIAPGINDNGRRSYDTKNKITMKIDLFKFSTLAKSIKFLAMSKNKDDEKKYIYSIFTDNGKTTKILAPAIYLPPKKKDSDNDPVELLLLFLKSDNNRVNFTIKKLEALTLAEELEEIAKFGREKELQSKEQNNRNRSSDYGNFDPSGAKSNKNSNQNNDSGFDDISSNDLPSDDELPF